MTSANRSSEPIAYEDEDAAERLFGIADAFLIGERPIARRVEDSVVRSSPSGAVMLRRGRGYAPAAVATIPTDRPVLALGADLKNAVTLVVDGQAFVSQHIGDLDEYEATRAFEETVTDLLEMYDVSREDLLVVHDAHPQYRSTAHAAGLGATCIVAVQHHRAHVASVLAERGAWNERVLGVSLDGTGYGDDGSIWGGEFFAGNIREGLERVAHLRPAALPGGDGASRHPVQAAAGFLDQVDGLPDLDREPFGFPARYEFARRLLRSGTRVFPTTSAGRLFDTAAALLGFTRPVTFEGQAAIWLEHLARGSNETNAIRLPIRPAVSWTGGRCCGPLRWTACAPVPPRTSRGRSRRGWLAGYATQSWPSAPLTGSAPSSHRAGFSRTRCSLTSSRVCSRITGSSSGSTMSSRRMTAASALDRPRSARSDHARALDSP